jgi:hypothetical protein
MPEQPAQPADHVKAHPLAEKVVWPLNLVDVKVLIEGVSPVDGQVYRVRSASFVDVAKPEHAAFVEVQPLDANQEMLIQITRPSEHHIVLVGQLVPDTEGTVYRVEQLREREL